MIAGPLDWMPWQVGVVLLVIMGVVVVAGTIYLWLWEMDLISDVWRDGIDAFRRGTGRIMERRIRRRLSRGKGP